MNQFLCTTHPTKEVGWVCIEKECENRLICSLCAVKLHNKSHQLECLENIQKQGIVAVLQQNFPLKDLPTED